MTTQKPQMFRFDATISEDGEFKLNIPKEPSHEDDSRNASRLRIKRSIGEALQGLKFQNGNFILGSKSHRARTFERHVHGISVVTNNGVEQPVQTVKASGAHLYVEMDDQHNQISEVTVHGENGQLVVLASYERDRRYPLEDSAPAL